MMHPRPLVPLTQSALCAEERRIEWDVFWRRKQEFEWWPCLNEEGRMTRREKERDAMLWVLYINSHHME